MCIWIKKIRYKEMYKLMNKQCGQQNVQIFFQKQWKRSQNKNNKLECHQMTKLRQLVIYEKDYKFIIYYPYVSIYYYILKLYLFISSYSSTIIQSILYLIFTTLYLIHLFIYSTFIYSSLIKTLYPIIILISIIQFHHLQFYIYIFKMGCISNYQQKIQPIDIKTGPYFEAKKVLYQQVYYVYLNRIKYYGQVLKRYMKELKIDYQQYEDIEKCIQRIRKNDKNVFRVIIYKKMDGLQQILKLVNVNQIYVVGLKQQEITVKNQMIITQFNQNLTNLCQNIQYNYTKNLKKSNIHYFTTSNQNTLFKFTLTLPNQAQIAAYHTYSSQILQTPIQTQLSNFSLLSLYQSYSSFQLLLRTLTHPQIHHYVKYPFYHIYHQLKNQPTPNLDQPIQVYPKMNLSQKDILILQKSHKKYLYLKTFLVCTKVKPQPSIFNITIEIPIQIKKDSEFGYCEISQTNQIIFNVLNGFYIQQFSKRKDQINLKLVYNGIEKHKIIQEQQIIVDAQDLWRLKKSSEIYRKFFIQQKFLWVDQNQSQVQIQKYITQLEIGDIVYMKQKSKFMQYIEMNNKYQFRVICSATFNIQFYKKLNNLDSVSAIFLFCSNLESGNKIKQDFYKIKAVSNIVSDLHKNIKNQQRQNLKFKTLPTFSKTNQDKYTVNKLRYSLYGLMTLKNRKNAKIHFSQLASYVYPDQKQTEVRQFLDQYPLDHQIEKVMKWYTKQCFFYKLTNNLIRLTNNPLELAYIRISFLDIFNSIKYLYKNQNPQQCELYRGGWMDENNINFLKKNKGKLIQMLGFMSTSRLRAVAQGFTNNVFFKIKIKKQKRFDEIDNGYADIAKFSMFPTQKEVLFNALNVFRIEDVDNKQGRNIITLKYGELAEIYERYSSNELLSISQRIQVNNYKHQRKKILMIKNQGNILSQIQYHDQAIKYFNNLVQLNINQNKLKAKSYFQIGKSNNLIGKYPQAIQYLIKSNQLYLQIDQQYSQDRIRSLIQLAKVYFTLQKFQLSSSNYSLALKLAQQLTSNQQQIKAQIYKNIAILQNKKGLYQQAILSNRTALKILQSISKQQNSSIAQIYGNIAQVYRQKGDYETALQNLNSCLSTYLATYGQSHSQTASTYNNIGLIHYAKRNYENALKYYEKAYSIYLDILGQKHIMTITVMNNIGTLQFSRGNFKQAQIKLILCQKLFKQILGQNNTDVASIQSNIASLYNIKKQYDKQVQYYMKILKIYVNVLGQNHDKVAFTYTNLAKSYTQSGNYQIAEQYFQKAIKISVTNLGQNHSNIALMYNNFGVLKKKLKKYQQALQYYGKSLDINISNFGEQNLYVAQNYSNIASIFHLASNFDHAIDYYKKALLIFQKKQINVEILNKCRHLGQVYRLKQQYNIALEYYLKAQQKLSSNQELMTAVYTQMGLLYLMNSEGQRSIEYYKKCLKRQLQISKGNNVQTGITYFNIGFVYQSAGVLEQAYKYYEKSYNIYLKQYGAQHQQTKSLDQRMKQCKLNQNKK